MENVYYVCDALSSGRIPWEYSYFNIDNTEDHFYLWLDFKIWSDRGINCYFTTLDGMDRKVFLTVYQNQKTNRFCYGDIDFSECPNNEAYYIVVKNNSKGISHIVNAYSTRTKT